MRVFVRGRAEDRKLWPPQVLLATWCTLDDWEREEREERESEE
jgi:hypothetical protein